MGELKSISGSAKLPYGTLALGTEGIKDAISGFEDAYVSSCSLQARAYSLLDENRISKTNACHLNCLTPKKPRRSSPNTRIRNPSPRRLRWAISPFPPLRLSKRASKRRCRPPRSRPHRATRPWAVPRRPRRRRPHRARYPSEADMGVKPVWERRERALRRVDVVWRVRFR